MPIKKATAFTASDGSMHASVEAAQRKELELIFNPPLAENDADHQLQAIINTVFAEADDIIAVLTTGPRSRPGARKSKGTVNPKRAAKATAATPAEAKAGFKTMREAVDREANNEGDMAAERLRQEVAKEGVPA
jgi:hypothetical protein